MKRWMLWLVAVMLGLSLFGCAEQSRPQNNDAIQYEGKTYLPLPLRDDIFFYGNAAPTDEEGAILPFSHEKWDLVAMMGDLYVQEEQAEEAAAYYGSDENYEWSVIVDDFTAEHDPTYPITVSEEDADYLYQMPEMEQDATLLFEAIEVSASLRKASKDGLVGGTISLAYSEGAWYWRSEVIDADAEGTPEYVQPLPQALARQIDAVLEK